MRKLELLNHYLNGRFYEYIDKWITEYKFKNKIDKEKYLKLYYIWNFSIIEEKTLTFGSEKFKEKLKNVEFEDSQKLVIFSLLQKLEQIFILNDLKAHIFEFLSEDIWHSVNFHEEKEKIVLDKISNHSKLNIYIS